MGILGDDTHAVSIDVVLIVVHLNKEVNEAWIFTMSIMIFPYLVMFDELDSNKDGFLDSKELSKAMDPSKAYLITKSKRVDKNRDGKLDRKEFRDFMDGSKKK